MRPISMERVEKTRENILGIITNKALTHEQKLTNLANAADGMLEVLDVPEGLDDLLNCDDEHRCICDLFEGHAPVRPRYIIPDYEKFFKNGSEFLQLDPPTDFFEALNDLLIIYKHVPSVTNYPVYLGQLDYLLEPFITDMDDETVKKHLKLFFTNIDRTVLDSFSHADIGPKATRAGYLILEVQAELENAIPNISMKYDPEITDDDFALACVKCALKTAKPSFANHRMFKNELGENYVIASCYNGLLLGGGAYTLCRLILGHIAERSTGIEDFKNNQLPYVMDIMAKYMDARIAFEVEQSGFFESNFLAKEGLIHRDRFTGMFGLVGLADAVNVLVVDLLALKGYGALGGDLQPVQAAQESGLAAAGRADQTDHIAAPDVNINAAQHVQLGGKALNALFLFAAIGLFQPADLQNIIGHLQPASLQCCPESSPKSEPAPDRLPPPKCRGRKRCRCGCAQCHRPWSGPAGQCSR